MYKCLFLLVSSYGWYFTFVQGFVYLILMSLQGFSTKQMVNPWKTYVKLSAVLMGSHGLTKGSLAFLNYPAQIMFKSTKVNPEETSVFKSWSLFTVCNLKIDKVGYNNCFWLRLLSLVNFVSAMIMKNQNT